MRYLSKKAALIPLMAGTALCLPVTAYAQSATQALLEEVVVTGTKKKDAENVQDVNAAVTALGDAQLEALKVKDLTSLSYSIPNVSLDDVGTFPGTANFSIRGLGINSSIPSIDPTVGVFVDGVYLGVNTGIISDLFDIESIEVLRGPQGVLFGRNVTGGAVLINTKKPSDELTVDAKVGIETGFRGTSPTYKAAGSISGPITEAISAKLAVYYNNDEGWHRRTLADGSTESFGDSRTVIVRPALYFTPNDRFDVTLRYEHGDINGDGPAAQNHTNGLGVTNPFFSAPRGTFTFSIDETGQADSSWDQFFVDANLDVDFGDGTITNIFGWRDYQLDAVTDVDATPLPLFHAPATVDQDQFSNEIRYNGTFFDILNVTTGFYFFTQDIAYNEVREIAFGTRFFNGGGVQDQKTYGFFTQLDIDLTDRLTLNLGGRYTYEKKDVVISNLILNQTPCDVREGTCSSDFVDGDSWENLGAKVGFQWAATDDLNLYTHWTRAFRSGGYNFRNTSLQFPIQQFDEERIDAFELGAKFKPISPRLTINTAFYLNKIDNLQRELNLSDQLTGVVQLTRNTADATIWGFEVDGQYAVTDNFLVRASVGHTDGEYDNVLFDLTGDGLINDTDLDLRIPRLAPWTYGGGFVYSQDLGDIGGLDLRFDYFHRDSSAYTDNNLGVLNNFDSITANASLTTLDGQLVLSVYGKNLLNEVQYGGDTQLPAALGGGTFSPLAKGRVIGFEAKFKY
ncbi:MAG: TonB-dependent receptor [Sphingomonadales bacterium]|jgi:iron complex outermembrane receptor protein